VHRIHTLALPQSALLVQGELSAPISTIYDSFRLTFTPGTALYDLLSPTNFLRSGQSEPSQAQYFAQLAILAYIHTLFWDYRDNRERLGTYMKDLQVQIVGNELDRTTSIELLLWIFRKGPHDKSLHRPKRAELALSIVNVSKTLSITSRTATRSVLQQLLIGCSAEVLPTLSTWTPDALEEELRGCHRNEEFYHRPTSRLKAPLPTCRPSRNADLATRE
jgi:hypothetical protein